MVEFPYVRSQPVLDFVFKDVFSMEYLYKGIHDWLEEEGYINSPQGVHEAEMESLYLERVSGGGAREIWIWWRTHREVSSHFRFTLDIDYHVLGLAKTEVMHEGQKMKMDSGEVEIFITPKVVFDPEGKWEKSFLFKNKMLVDHFKKRMFKKEVEEKERLLIRDSNRLLDYIKQFFELKPFLKEYLGEPYKPPKGKGM